MYVLFVVVVLRCVLLRSVLLCCWEGKESYGHWSWPLNDGQAGAIEERNVLKRETTGAIIRSKCNYVLSIHVVSYHKMIKRP